MYAIATLADQDAALIADETGDLKKGRKSAGVQRQYTGTAGRIENAQVSVHLSYGSSRGRTLIDRELYLGKDWAGTTAEHERRCAEQDIPPERTRHMATKPELARRMLERALAASVPFGYFLADEAYGQCRPLGAWLEERQVRYVLAVPKDETVPLPDGRTRQAGGLYAIVPEDALERRSCADGAKGQRLQIESGILQVYTRTPTLTAMTAAGLDYVSDGRFTLGLGASGPQVIEGFHGVRYDAPLGRTREIIEICRQVWRRERVEHDGKHYQIPLLPPRGSGLGKPLKLINHPVRPDIPVTLAAIGPKNVALAAEIAEGWQPILFHPGRASAVWGESLAEGLAKRDHALRPLDVMAPTAVAIDDDVEDLIDLLRPRLALYIGGMGARDKNFYNELTCRYGYEAAAKTVQELYLEGKKDEAEAAVPEDLIRALSLVGPEGYVRDRIAEFQAAGTTTLMVTPLVKGRAATVRLLETLRGLLP